MSTDIERPIACAALAAALILGTASAAAAQAMPGPRGPVGPGIAAGALARAYQAIGEAEAVNGRSVYVGQAREHYTGAYARYHRRDARGAAAEAMAAASLAQAAIDARPRSAPLRLEPPPQPDTNRFGPHFPEPPGAGAPGMPPPGMGRPGIGRPGGNPLARLVALDPTLEVQTLAERATAAAVDAARMRAANDQEGALRFGHLSRDLVRAIHGLVAASQPPRRRGGPALRRPLGLAPDGATDQALADPMDDMTTADGMDPTDELDGPLEP